MPELYTITPLDYLIALLAWVAISLLSVAGGAWVWAARPTAEPEVESEAGTDPDATVEVRPPTRRHRTGTIHAPQYVAGAADDRTVVIERATS